MAAQAREERESAAAERREQSNKLWKACLEASVSAKKRSENSSPPEVTR
jgi:hypothetical protein